MPAHCDNADAAHSLTESEEYDHERHDRGHRIGRQNDRAGAVPWRFHTGAPPAGGRIRGCDSRASPFPEANRDEGRNSTGPSASGDDDAVFLANSRNGRSHPILETLLQRRLFGGRTGAEVRKAEECHAGVEGTCGACVHCPRAGSLPPF
jgi:hypothetical protein